MGEIPVCPVHGSPWTARGEVRVEREATTGTTYVLLEEGARFSCGCVYPAEDGLNEDWDPEGSDPLYQSDDAEADAHGG